MKGVGTECKIWYDCGPRSRPEEGDFIATPAGSCYQVLTVRRSPSRPSRVNMTCVRLEKGAVEIGEPGVWPLYWYSRTKRA